MSTPTPPAAPEVEFRDDDTERRYLSLEDLESPEEPSWSPPAAETPPGETPFFKDYEATAPPGTWTWDDIEGVAVGLPDLTDLDAVRLAPDTLDAWSLQPGEVVPTSSTVPALERVRKENQHLKTRQPWLLMAGILSGLVVGLALGAWLI